MGNFPKTEKTVFLESLRGKIHILVKYV